MNQTPEQWISLISSLLPGLGFIPAFLIAWFRKGESAIYLAYFAGLIVGVAGTVINFIFIAPSKEILGVNLVFALLMPLVALVCGRVLPKP
jgi:hypothetical protein